MAPRWTLETNDATYDVWISEHEVQMSILQHVGDLPGGPLTYNEARWLGQTLLDAAEAARP